MEVIDRRAKIQSGLQLAILLLVLLSWAPGTLAQAPIRAAESDHSLFTEVLKDHVRGDRVDYARLKLDARLEDYIDQLQNTNPSDFGPEEAKAFWLNVYNAFTLKLIVENYPVTSINELHFCGSLYLGTALGRTVWKTWQFEIYGETYTLDRVEHEILRGRYRDFRVHAGLVCASVGCPPLRAEAYEKEHIEEQLDDQMRQWLADENRNYYDHQSNTLHLSRIFDWFENDFTGAGRSLVEAILPFMRAEDRNAIEQAAQVPAVEFRDYDWSLNDPER